MKKTDIKKLPTPIVISIAAVAVLIAATVALFVSVEDFSRLFTVSSFTSSGEIYFDDSGSRIAPTTVNGYRNSDGTINVDYTDDTAANYIGKLRVNVNYSGYGVGLIRVRIAEEWSKTSAGIKTVMPYSIEMPYTVTQQYSGSGNQSTWFDNRANDYCMYYATPVYATSGSAVTIPLISGFDVNSIDLGAIASDIDLRLAVEIDVVQVNRYPQLWGISALPWTNASSATESAVS